jgi:Asp-tRNA(Asn)/Glu-tRNA(Gln) amidotransferase A subunit family amidase
MKGELAGLDATAQAALVRSGEASPVELVEAAIGGIDALNPQLNAVIHPLFEKGLEAARGGLPDGPFKGVPFLLKDLLAHSAGDPLHEGMKHLRDLDWIEDEDTELVRRFRAAFWNATGQPAISLPLHWNDEGLPIGVQLIAPFGREDLLIRVAAQLEQASPWVDRRPPVFAGAAAVP